MELRLQQFIDSVSVLADIRNLDTFNPIVFQIENPVTATRYTIAGAKAEPSYLGIPINTTWVVLDPQNPYYRMALKLVDVNNPEQSTTLPVIHDDTGNLNFYWNIIRTYDEIFSVPQYYSNAGKGPKGDKGDPGAAGTVDYSLLLAQLTSLTGTLVINGLETMNENTTQQLTLTLTEPQVLTDGTVTQPVARTVVAPISLIGQVPAGTYIDAQNILHAGDLTDTTIIQAYASFPSWAKPAAATMNITLQNTLASVTGVAISGSQNVNSGATSQYTISVTWSDGSVTHPSATWELDSADFGTVDQTGLLSVPSAIAASGSVNVSATLDLLGVTYTPNMTVIVTKVAVAPTVVNTSVTGPTALNSGSQGSYLVSIGWSDNSVTHPTAAWTLNSAAFGTISSTGVFNVPSTIAASGTATVTATFVVDGVTYHPTLNVAVTKVVVAPTVTSVTINGSASALSGTSSQYLITAMWSNGTTTNPAADDWSLDSAVFGAISSGGMLTVPSDIAASGNVVVSADVVVGGTTYHPTKTVAVTLFVPSAAVPRYGVGASIQADWPAFIMGLTGAPALTGDGKYQVSIDVVGQSTFQYFAYPAQHGEATFYDKLSQFFGGFGGAGNNGAGPSQQTITNYKDMPVTIDVAGTPYYLYRSDFANLGAAAGNQWEITLTTP